MRHITIEPGFLKTLLCRRFLGVLTLVQKCFPAMFAELLEFFLDLVVALLVVCAYIIAGFAFTAIPGAKLTFSSSHKIVVRCLK